jgi:hypothetical protein|tara:strand:+ start:6927 stop:7841 length:915 start_codon:yes stop_codon:yes gene_type:complete
MPLYDDLIEKINSSNTLDEDHINDGMALTETFVNAGITSKELQNKAPIDHPVFVNEGWVSSEHIYRPEFYGSPSPRMVAVSGQTHFRETKNSINDGVIFNSQSSGTGYLPVPGTTTSIKLRQSATVNVMCSFYCYEFGGVNDTNRYRRWWGTTETGGYENKIAAYTFLQVNGINYSHTRRKIYTSTCGGRSQYYTGTGVYGDGPTGGAAGHPAINGFLEFPMIGRHQHFFNIQLDLAEGVHDIGLACYPVKGNEVGYPILTHYISHSPTRYGFSEKPFIDKSKFIFFQARNFIVDAYYRDLLPE